MERASPRDSPSRGSDQMRGQLRPVWTGRYLAFTGRETGEFEVYVQRVDGMKLLGGWCGSRR